ncbi:MAG TPA: IS256 family transposase [Thermoanaerobaculaceae bacterium]|nr:IS256 family transposase [Thermoanaerobaculaceae bacterium]
MARRKSTRNEVDWKAALVGDDVFRELLRVTVQEVLEAEMEEAVGAGKWERTEDRLGYRSGYRGRTLVTRVGKLELRVPQDRAGRFSTELFERYQRSEKAFVSALAEMYIQGVSTRKVKAITEELCGHTVSASTVSAINAKLDEDLERFARRGLEEPYPYLVLDARYEKIRDEGVIRSRAVLVAIGVNWDGRRCVLGVELANRESASSWKDFLLSLKERGLDGVEVVVSDDHPGLRRATTEVIPEAAWQRCYVHFLRNALDYLPRRGDDDCLKELRWIYDRRNLEEARRDLAAWLGKWQTRYPKLCDWVESNIEETLTFYRLPLSHHKHMKSTNMLERQNEEIKRRTRVVRIFPNAESCLRLIRALAIEMHENWIEAIRYLNMDDLREHKKEALRRLDAAA